MTIAERNKKLKHFIACLKCKVSGKCCDDNCSTQYDAGNMGEIIENLEAITKVLENVPKKGYWLRMSEKQGGDTYKCSRCGNVIRYKNKMNPYTFHSWCSRCESENRRKIEATV